MAKDTCNCNVEAGKTDEEIGKSHYINKHKRSQTQTLE
jgi:hypothetical protein